MHCTKATECEIALCLKWFPVFMSAFFSLMKKPLSASFGKLLEVEAFFTSAPGLPMLREQAGVDPGWCNSADTPLPPLLSLAGPNAGGAPEQLLPSFSCGLSCSGCGAQHGTESAVGRFPVPTSTPTCAHPCPGVPGGPEQVLEREIHPCSTTVSSWPGQWGEPQSHFCPAPDMGCGKLCELLGSTGNSDGSTQVPPPSACSQPAK